MIRTLEIWCSETMTLGTVGVAETSKMKALIIINLSFCQDAASNVLGGETEAAAPTMVAKQD